ncbi:hypothetical protein H4S04_004678 [Coemansia sp. S16]|nr:hypothetical protein H4S04_004678 [Coemansia sp. S16]
MERSELESALTYLQLARDSLCEQIEKNSLEVKKFTEARDILDQVMATVAKYAVPVVRNPPASLTVPTSSPVIASDAEPVLSQSTASVDTDAYVDVLDNGDTKARQPIADRQAASRE